MQNSRALNVKLVKFEHRTIDRVSTRPRKILKFRFYLGFHAAEEIYLNFLWLGTPLTNLGFPRVQKEFSIFLIGNFSWTT